MLYVTLIALAVLMLILLNPTDIVSTLSYADKKSDGCIFVRYAFLKFRIYPSGKNETDTTSAGSGDRTKKDANAANAISFFKTAYDKLIDDIKELFKYLAKKAVRIKRLDISAKFGTGNPMYTGIAYGTVSAIVYNAVGWLDRNLRLDSYNVKLDGDFDGQSLSGDVYCVVRTRLLHAFVIGGLLIKMVVKIKKIDRRIKKDV